MASSTRRFEGMKQVSFDFIHRHRLHLTHVHAVSQIPVQVNHGLLDNSYVAMVETVQMELLFGVFRALLKHVHFWTVFFRVISVAFSIRLVWT